MEKVSMSHFFSFSRYQTKRAKFLHVINCKIFLESTSKAMADWEKKGKTEIQKFEYLENEKSIFDEIKNI